MAGGGGDDVVAHGLQVAERLAAAPGSKVYGVPSVKARWYGDVAYAGNVSPRVFWPEPNVDSGLVRIERTQRPEGRSGREQVFSVVDAAFAQRRKSLRGALAGLAGSAATSECALREAGIDPRTRGEEHVMNWHRNLVMAIQDLQER